MPTFIRRIAATAVVAMHLSFVPLCQEAMAGSDAASGQSDHATLAQLRESLRVGDVVFIHVSALPFEKVALATGSWTNHVGIVVDVSGDQPVIAESTVPWSRTSTLSRFVARSKGGRVAVRRLDRLLTDAERSAIMRASRERLGVRYDTGFDLHSRGQFCSRFVREVMAEATGIAIGDVQTFDVLFKQNPEADLGFWRLWYFGHIPWERETVTPAAVFRSARLHVVFDGYARP